MHPDSGVGGDFRTRTREQILVDGAQGHAKRVPQPWRPASTLDFAARDALLLRLSAAVCDLLVQSPVTDRETRREIEGLMREVRKNANG